MSENAPARPGSIRLQGIPVSPGVHIGEVAVHNPGTTPVSARRIAPNQIARQIRMLKEALRRAAEELTELRGRVLERLDEAHASIFDTHILFLSDPSLRDQAAERIAKRRETAARAVTVVIGELAEQFRNLGDSYVSSRATDVLDVGRRICKHLTGQEGEGPVRFTRNVVLFAGDLTPSDTAQMDHRHVKAFATEIGGPTSHTAILAKALEIPAVVGLGDLLRHVNAAGTTHAIIDGYEGTVTINPNLAEVREARNYRRRRLAHEKSLRRLRDLPSETIDGFNVRLRANVEFPDELPHVAEHGASGIGLFRTEFLYLERTELPSEEEQTVVYRRVLESVAPDEVTFRTLDVGGDKFHSRMNSHKELNPFLGLRAIRFCLERPDIFRTQLRALLRASAFGKARIMFPMVSTLHEVERARELLDESREDLRKAGHEFDPNIEIGIMIEIPSAAINADLFAPEVDFFSIGTNDLIQYTLAVDRSNEKIAYLYDPYHPAILRLIRRSVDAATRAGIQVSVCGEMAANPVTALLLVGMGIRDLSMGAVAVPQVKYLLRNSRLSEVRGIATDVYALGTSAQVRDYVETTCRELFGKRVRAWGIPQSHVPRPKYV